MIKLNFYEGLLIFAAILYLVIAKIVTVRYLTQYKRDSDKEEEGRNSNGQ